MNPRHLVPQLLLSFISSSLLSPLWSCSLSVNHHCLSAVLQIMQHLTPVARTRTSSGRFKAANRKCGRKKMASQREEESKDEPGRRWVASCDTGDESWKSQKSTTIPSYTPSLAFLSPGLPCICCVLISLRVADKTFSLCTQRFFLMQNVKSTGCKKHRRPLFQLCVHWPFVWLLWRRVCSVSQ